MPLLMEQFYAPQVQQAELQKAKTQNELGQLQVEQTRRQIDLQQQASVLLQQQAAKEEQTPTSSTIGADGGVVSPIISQLKETSKIQAKLGDVEGYRKSLKDIIEAENKESEILKRNADIAKEQAGYKASAAQYALESKDIEGGLSILAKTDPITAMKLYAALPKDSSGKIQYTPQVEQLLKKTIAESTTFKDMADIQRKAMDSKERERENRQRDQDRAQAQADRRADQADRREERKQRMEDKKESKVALYKTASIEANSAYDKYKHSYQTLRRDLIKASTKDEKEAIKQEMEDLTVAYKDETSSLQEKWSAQGLNVTPKKSSEVKKEISMEEKVKASGIPYEPEKYEYRVLPSGEVQRKAKG